MPRWNAGCCGLRVVRKVEGRTSVSWRDNVLTEEEILFRGFTDEERADFLSLGEERVYHR